MKDLHAETTLEALDYLKAVLDTCADLEECCGINAEKRHHLHSASIAQMAVIIAVDTIRDAVSHARKQLQCS